MIATFGWLNTWVPISVTENTAERPAQGSSAMARRRRRSGAEVMTTPKMGCPENKEAKGGRGTAREAQWRRGDGERRPAVGTKGGGGAREREGGK